MAPPAPGMLARLTAALPLGVPPAVAAAVVLAVIVVLVAAVAAATGGGSGAAASGQQPRLAAAEPTAAPAPPREVPVLVPKTAQPEPPDPTAAPVPSQVVPDPAAPAAGATLLAGCEAAASHRSDLLAAIDRIEGDGSEITAAAVDATALVLIELHEPVAALGWTREANEIKRLVAAVDGLTNSDVYGTTSLDWALEVLDVGKGIEDRCVAETVGTPDERRREFLKGGNRAPAGGTGPSGTDI